MELMSTQRDTNPDAGKRVTMATVGRLAGVSQVTVSRALSDPSKVSPQTLQRIREAIELTGFVPNALAGALASRKSKLISALVPSITNIVYSAMIQAFSDGMRGHGYQILLSETGFDLDDEARVISAHLSRRPDAMLLTGVHHSVQARKALLGAAIPVVELWDITETPIDLCIGFSHADSARAVADFVMEQGYQQIGTVCAGDERACRRRDVFTDRVRQVGSAPVSQVNFDTSASLGRGREALARLIDEQGFRQGIVVCSSDLLAHGVIIEAQSRGLDIPGTVAVIGFGDQEFAPHVDPGLSSVRVDRTALGMTAAQSLIARMEGLSPTEKSVDLGFEIIRRGSA